jgi:hypothetical protein
LILFSILNQEEDIMSCVIENDNSVLIGICENLNDDIIIDIKDATTKGFRILISSEMEFSANSNISGIILRKNRQLTVPTY